MKGSTKKETVNNYDVKVTRAKEFDNGSVAFDVVVNGVTIYGCWYREGEKDGKEYEIINFPSQEGKDGKYYNIAWFKIEDELKADIIAQLQKLV